MARPKLGEGDTQRLQLKISDEELAAIDDWRFANRVASRSEAVRRLCQIGLEADSRLDRIRQMVDEETLRVSTDFITSMTESEPLGEDVKLVARSYVDLIQSVMRSVEANAVIRNAISELQTKTSTYREPGKISELRAKVDEVTKDFEHLAEIMSGKGPKREPKT